MTREELHDFLLKQPHAECVYKEEWEAFLYKLKDKIFAMIGEDKDKNAIITIKLNPAKGAAIRAQYPSVTPGYYMNKTHWNSITIANPLPATLMSELISESYALIYSSLPKKIRDELCSGL